ncbi:hypothetical protein EV426DRAFT_687743 [Tirmania nivea]|nr:hypothetical protein EV426DRAFT_687743 [Tirmania nivea]
MSANCRGLETLERKRLFEPSPTNDLIVISVERLQMLDENWNKDKINLLRSPLASGKTTLSRYFASYSKAKGRKVFIISLTYLMDSNMMEDEVSFNSTWELSTGSSWEKIRWCKEPIDIFIDEAQIAYGTAKYFWGRIKDLLTVPNDNVRILLLSMYSDRPGVIGNTRTPIDFPNALGLETLCLTQEEFDILIDRYIEYICSIDICRLSIPQDIRDAIFSCTGGYPSLVHETLKSLYGHFRRNGSRIDDMLHHLVSKKFFFAINSLRVFDAIVKLEMTDANITFLRDAYHSINNDLTFAVDLANDVIDGLKRSGLIGHEVDIILSKGRHFASWQSPDGSPVIIKLTKNRAISNNPFHRTIAAVISNHPL